MDDRWDSSSDSGSRRIDPYCTRVEELLDQKCMPPLDEWLAEDAKNRPEADPADVVFDVLNIIAHRCSEFDKSFEPLIAEVLQRNPVANEVFGYAFGGDLAIVLRDQESEIPRPRRDEVIGDYVFKRCLGGGGQGRVYLGQRTSDERNVAIKVLRRDRPAAARASSETEKLRHLPRHAGLVQLIDSFPCRLGECVVVEYVDGTPLHKKRESIGRPDEPRLLRWMCTMANAICAAHERQVSHRDLKPSNVLVTTGEVADGGDEPVIIDFGLGLFDANITEDFAAKWRIVGTQGYEAPEITKFRRGDDRPAEPISPWTLDVFGLGAILYFLATNQPPCPPDSLVTVDFEAVYRRIKAEIRRSGISADLQYLCLDALYEFPDHRIQTAKDFFDRLNEVYVRTHDAGAARQPNADSAAREIRTIASWHRRLPIIASAIISVAACIYLVAANSGLLPLWNSAGDARTPAQNHDGLQPIVDSPWRQTMHEQQIDPTSIVKSDLHPRILTAKRSIFPWEDRDPSKSHEATLEIDLSPRLADLSRWLSWRVGKRPWEGMWRPLDTRIPTAHLSSDDLRVDSPLEIRIGDSSHPESIVGPFRFEISVRESIKQDELAWLKERIAAVDAEHCFDTTHGKWSMRLEFDQRYGPIIRSIRFGGTPTSLDHEARAGGPTGARNFYTDNPLPDRQSLADSFADVVGDLNSSFELWYQFEFIDGSTSDARRAGRHNRYGHDGTVENARQLLASMPAEVPMGRFRGARFSIDGLARIDDALTAIEFGESPDQLDYSYSVIGDRRRAKLAGTAAKEPTSTSSSSSLVGLIDGLSRAFYTSDGIAETAVMAPPIWPRIYFRGRYTDETATPAYSAENLARLPGFPADLLGVQRGDMELPLFVVVRPHFGIDTETSPPSTLEHLPTFQWDPIAEYFVLAPATVASIRFYRNESLQDEVTQVEAGIVFASFHDHDDRRLGSCTYRIDGNKLSEAISAMTQMEKDGWKPPPQE